MTNRCADPAAKIITLEQACLWHAQLRSAGQTLAITNGAFDLLHRGHADYLWQASQEADHLLVAVNSDASVRSSKGSDRPVVNETDRAYLLASLACVDAVVIFEQPKPVEVFQKISPDVYVKGGDYTEASLDREEHALLKQGGARFVFIPLLEGRSTTATVRRVREGRSAPAELAATVTPAVAPSFTGNPRLDFIFRRRSVRRFQPRPVSEELLQDLLQAGMSAPSAGARDPWHFVVLDDASFRSDLASRLPNGPFLAQAGAAIVVCGDVAEAHDQLEAFLLVDCAAAIENILLAASALGLGACWLGIHPRVERMAMIKELLHLPPSVIPVGMVAIGWPADDPPPRTRLKQAKIHRNQFQA